MPLVTVYCHCCKEPFERHSSRLGKNKSGLLHCTRKCQNLCPDLHVKTAWYWCKQCGEKYSPHANFVAGGIRSLIWCSTDCRSEWQSENGRMYKERSDKGTIWAVYVEEPCWGCGVPVRRPASRIREFVYCTPECYQKNGGSETRYRAQHKRTTDMTWQTRDYGLVNARIDKDGYVALYIPNHPNCQFTNRSVKAHRVVMEEHVGRLLDRNEIVHHKDGDRQNNDISNLELCRHYQPPGQRVRDQVAAARALLAKYGHLFPEGEAADTLTLFDEPDTAA